MSCFISEIIQDVAICSYSGVLCDLTNGVISSDFEWPLKVTRLFNITSGNNSKGYKIQLYYLQWQTSMKSCIIYQYQLVPISVTLNELETRFQGYAIILH